LVYDISSKFISENYKNMKKKKALKYYLTLVLLFLIITISANNNKLLQTETSGFIYIITDKTVSFTNNSKAEGDQFYWDFGTGETSTEENPTQIFKTFGEYTITLSIFLKNKLKARYTEKIKVIGKYSLSGQIMMGENPLPNGNVFLITNSKSTYNNTANTNIEDGVFSFSDITSGEYTLYAVPEPDYGNFYFPKYIPTYTGNVYKWEKADKINLERNLTEFKINLTSFKEPYYGHSCIKGKFKFDDNYNETIETPLIVILLNNNREPMDFKRLSPYNTEYCFEYLPTGKYHIHIEKAGCKAIDYEINIQENEPENISYNFIIGEDVIKREDLNSEENITIAPFQQQLKISVPNYEKGIIICEIFDTAGRMIYQKTENSSIFSINTTQINGGMYFLRINSFDNKNIRVSKIFINN